VVEETFYFAAFSKNKYRVMKIMRNYK